MKHFRNDFRYQAGQRGFSIMEVLIGIAIFAIGMLALASLQGALTRSTAEAKVRTTAVNIAERVIEGQRGFALVTSTPGEFSFANIGDDTFTVDSTMMRVSADADAVGVTYTVTQDVTEYYYDLASDADADPDTKAFTTTEPTGGAVKVDYKTVLVTVAWNDNRDFVIDENTPAADLGGGSVQLSATISNLSVVAALTVSEQDDGDIIAPKIVYTPGARPEIVRVSLSGDEGKFKESLTPKPKVYATNLETRFEVITYSQTSGNQFLRREEFVAVSCECELKAADASNPGKRPAIWAGDEYVDPEFVKKVPKPYGIPLEGGTKQSDYCGICCRDHHDGGTGDEDPEDANGLADKGAILFNPFRAADPDVLEGDDHKHYTKVGAKKVDGTLEVAFPGPGNSGGDSYVEACKLVRVDGFFRVAQDFRLEGLNVFPEDYLVISTQVDDYSDYITGEVSTFLADAIEAGNNYQAIPLTVTPPERTQWNNTPPVTNPLTLAYTNLPTAVGPTQQLRSRSLYIDYLSDDLRSVINCINDVPDGISDAQKLEAERLKRQCKSGNVELDKTGSTNILELVPFFELQTTFLNGWEADFIDTIIKVTSDPIKTDVAGPIDTYSRGKASLVLEDGQPWAFATAHRGVLGLTATDPIDIEHETMEARIQVVLSADTPTDPVGIVIRGVIMSRANNVQARNVSVLGIDASCNFTNPDFICFVPNGAPNPTMTVSQDTYTDVVFSSNLVETSSTLPLKSGDATSCSPAIFDLSVATEGTDYIIWLDDEGSCDDGFGFP